MKTVNVKPQNSGPGAGAGILTSYGSVAPHRQAELIRALGANNAEEPASHELKKLMAAVAKRHGISMNNL